MLLTPKTRGGYRNVFDKVVLISQTAKLSGQWDVFDQDVWQVYDEYNPQIITDVMNTQSEQTEDRDRVLIILDDMSSKTRKAVKSTQVDPLDTLACNGRHLGISVWFLCQVYTQTSTSLRSNADLLINFACHSLRDMLALYNECGGCIKYKDFRQRVASVTDKKYHFIAIRNVGGRLRYYHNFEEINIM